MSERAEERTCQEADRARERERDRKREREETTPLEERVKRVCPRERDSQSDRETKRVSGRENAQERERGKEDKRIFSKPLIKLDPKTKYRFRTLCSERCGLCLRSGCVRAWCFGVVVCTLNGVCT